MTSWNEGFDDEGDYLNVTLGSLLGKSIDLLETLDIISDTAENEDEPVRGGDVDEEELVRTNEESMGGVEGPETTVTSQPTSEQLTTLRPQFMQNRGMPYFEEMVENSRLGRIKRQKGGHTSRDGRKTVQWEVVELGGNDASPMETDAGIGGDRSSNKRQKTDM